jgi:predicted amidohydrolase YtcJ
VLAKDNRLSRVEALGLFTRTPAWFMNAESEMGMIAPGHLADFVLLDRDYLAVAESKIKSIASILTVMDGRVVYGAQDYHSLSPALPEILPTWSPIKYFGGYPQAQ